MSEMVERVARAMIAAIDDDEVYVGDDGRGAVADIREVMVDGRVNFDTVIRAAIAAMREPTEAMWLAPARREISVNGVLPTGEECFEIWRAMNDAAL